MVDVATYYNERPIKVDAINCTSPLRNISKAFKHRAFIRSLRFIFVIVDIVFYLQSDGFFSLVKIWMIPWLLVLFSFFFWGTDNIWLPGPKWPLSYTIAAESIWLYDIPRIIESIEWLHLFKIFSLFEMSRKENINKQIDQLAWCVFALTLALILNLKKGRRKNNNNNRCDIVHINLTDMRYLICFCFDLICFSSLLSSFMHYRCALFNIYYLTYSDWDRTNI